VACGVAFADSWETSCFGYLFEGKMNWFSVKTRAVRHFVVRLVAPQVYAQTRVDRVRSMTAYLKNNFVGPLVGVEIGVLKGVNAKIMLQNLPMKMLYLVDPYCTYVDHDEIIQNFADCLPLAKRNLSKFEDKTTFIIKKSDEAVDLIPDNLDFVYIDGNHAYDFVKRDIELYWPKIRRGGVLGGHDFHIGWKGVAKAVVEFALKDGLEFYGGAPSDWWIIK